MEATENNGQVYYWPLSCALHHRFPPVIILFYLYDFCG